MQLRGIAYLGLDVPDVDAWASFATSVVGLMPALDPPGGNAPGVVHLKADEHQWRLALHPAEQPGIRYAGFEVGSQRAFTAAVDELAASGVAWERGSPDECDARGVRDLVWAFDPTGVRVEVCWGPKVDGRFVSPVGVPRFVTGALGFGHYVVLTPDLPASMDFYTRVLGLRLTDYVVFGDGMSVQFLRCTPRHHSVALTAVGPVRGVHHIAFEVGDIDQVGYALERATRGGHPITASLGRHKNDRMLSFYMRSPAGFEVEIGSDGRLIDEDTWVVNEFTGGDEWGHHGLTGDALADSVAAQ
ncbi:MAG TPA: VOC family protein [Frankiaceae bacterium]|jgi:3,4-dihydroxy-9,10-secoandrosta-1,3,5(10)-triene-9,17-dione 4,5-dioxygenase|nr:VOC family protein [Frankiaceae bacterium]